MISEMKAQWSESSLLLKSINIISIVILSISILLLLMSSLISENKQQEIGLNLIKSQLKIIDKFDQKFPGKWRHYLNNPVVMSDLKSDLDELGLPNIKIANKDGIFSLSGQVSSIKEISNLISYTYNYRGLTVNQLNLDVISEDLINIDLALIY
tara:strand:+ start:1626 stop:2087 length:462 start_codon:yes stop_codon:yes gene_type:complete